MKKLYTEKQYNKYCNLLEELANEDDMIIGLGIHLEIEDWLKEDKISAEAKKQMDQRIDDEASGTRPELKRIK